MEYLVFLKYYYYNLFLGLCTSDGKTELKDGIVFGNKLYSPVNGSAYNI